MIDDYSNNRKRGIFMKTIEIDNDIHQKLKTVASIKKIPMKTLIGSLLDERLSRNDEDIKNLEKILKKIENMEGIIDKIEEVK